MVLQFQIGLFNYIKISVQNREGIGIIKLIMPDFRIEKDSLGEVKVPVDALYGAQTQRAVLNFPVSGRLDTARLALLRAAARGSGSRRATEHGRARLFK